MINRHPFPGPGLGVRVLGEVKKNTAIYYACRCNLIEELRNSGWYEKRAKPSAYSYQ